MSILPTRPQQAEPESIPFVDWQDFLDNYFRWRQGEHVAAIAPTNSGKTTLLLNLLPFRKYVTVVATKPKDATLNRLVKTDGFLRMKEWENYDPTLYSKRLLWPAITNLDQVNSQRTTILTALKQIYGEGGWCVYFDELWYIIHLLKLEKTVRVYLQQARSIGISLVVGTQRPAFVPLEVYDQSTHLFFWRDNDETNLRRISGIAYLSARLVRGTIANLREHETLYINTRSGAMIRTICPPPEGVR